MTELRIRTPGEPERTVPLVGPSVVVGRGADADVQIVEIRASRRHLRLDRTPAGWAATDLGSGNGTLVGEERILRRAIGPGDVVRVGETTLSIAESAESGSPAAPAAAPPPVLVGGKLRIEVVEPGAAAPAPSAAPESGVGPAATASPPRAPSSRRRPPEEDVRRTVRRALPFLAIGLAAVVLVEVVVPPIAAGRRVEAKEADDYTRLLASADLSFATFDEDVSRFFADYPRSRYRPALERFVEEKRKQHERFSGAERDLERLQRAGDAVPASEARAALVSLRRANPDDERLRRRIDLALEGLDRDAAARRAQDVDAALRDADAALGRSDPASALRALAAARARHEPLPPDERARLDGKEHEALAEVGRIANAAVAAAGGVADLDARRTLLAKALSGLAGTMEEERVLGALRAGVPGDPARVPSPGAAPTPPAAAPTAAPEVLAKAGEAEGLAKARAFARAAEAYAALGAAEAPASWKEEWSARSDELRRIASLVTDLAAAIASAGDRPVRVRLAEGMVDVVSATPDGVSTRRRDETTARSWGDLPPPDVVALLSRPRPTPDQRLAAALLAADLGERQAAVENLSALVATESHRDLAFRAIARRLEGRKEVPEGGYVVDGKDLVDRAEHARRVEARRLAALRAEATALVGKLAAEPAFKRLDAVREKRDELDRRRARALLAIFDEKHYPYPKEPASAYHAAQAEIDLRIAAVEEIWGDPVSAHPGRLPSVRTALARHRQVLRELAQAGQEVADLAEAVRPFSLHATADPVTVRTYARDEAEREVVEYSRWVMESYNPFQTAVATPVEREQVRITNEYRMMMGWAFAVAPSGAPVEAVDSASAAAIFDQGRETGRSRLRAVRIDDRLVRSARFHSEDMAARGFFDHVAPPDAGKGLPATQFHERMAKQGYAGSSASENLMQGRADPGAAHMGWRHSSGHHRNLLSVHDDMGAGLAGRYWTQNFGAGGGAAPEIPRAGAATPADDAASPSAGDEEAPGVPAEPPEPGGDRGEDAPPEPPGR